MSTYHQSYKQNTVGNDYVVGDIHGRFTKLQKQLDTIGFNPSVDRLFSVGDLVDRGPESHLALEWIAKDWFHCIQGNHEDYVIRYKTVDKLNHRQNGGYWFYDLTEAEKAAFSETFAALPFAIDVERADGKKIGIVHANWPDKSWDDITPELGHKNVQDFVQWNRDRIQWKETHGVPGIHAVVLGHTPVNGVQKLGNCYFIDTAAWYYPDRDFEIIDLENL